MNGGRAAQELLGREFVPAHHAKRASLFSLSRGNLYFDFDLRRLESALVFRWIRNWRLDNCARDQRCFAQWLYFWLSFLATLGRWLSRSIFQVTSVLSRLRLRELFQPASHALGVAESVLGRLHRSLRATLRNWHLARLANPVTFRQ